MARAGFPAMIAGAMAIGVCFSIHLGVAQKPDLGRVSVVTART